LPPTRRKIACRLPFCREGKGLEAIGWGITEPLFKTIGEETSPDLVDASLEHGKRRRVAERESDQSMRQDGATLHESERVVCGDLADYDGSLQTSNCLVERRGSFPEPPPVLGPNLAVLLHPIRLHLPFDDLHQVRPLACLAFRHLTEVDDVPIV